MSVLALRDHNVLREVPDLRREVVALRIVVEAVEVSREPSPKAREHAHLDARVEKNGRMTKLTIFLAPARLHYNAGKGITNPD